MKVTAAVKSVAVAAIIFLFHDANGMVGPKNPANVVNERRDQVWLLMLKGESQRSIKRGLNLTNPTL
jgi:hypothetical protein